MKRKSFIIAILFLISTTITEAQTILGALALGVNLTQVDGDEVYGFHKFGLNAGPMGVLKFNKHWSVSLETIFNQKGSYQKPRYADSASGEYSLKLNYVEVPLIAHFEDKETWNFGLGFSWGKLVNVKEYQHGKQIETTTIKGPYKTSDWDIIADVQFRIWKGFKFDARYAYSLTPIRTREFDNTLVKWTRKQYNNIITFRVIYVINDDSKPREKKSKKKFHEIQVPE
jgi:hypothetical protein